MNPPDVHVFDAVVIGAGIAGASAAAYLALDRRVALIEAEESAGYHTSGRSSATWFLNYGPSDVRAMTGASGAFFQNPPTRFHRRAAHGPTWRADARRTWARDDAAGDG